MKLLKIIFWAVFILGLIFYTHIVLTILAIIVVILFVIAMIQFAIRVNKDCGCGDNDDL